MNIQKRLRISYILMLLIPMCLIMFTGGIIRHLYDPEYKKRELPGEFYKELYRTMAENPESLLEKQYLEKLEDLTGYSGRVNMYVYREERTVNRLENFHGGKHHGDGNPMDIFTDWTFRFSDGSAGEFSLFVFDSQRVSGAFISGGVILLAAIVILLLTNGLLSWYMTRSITKPLKVLEKAALQIKNEDLETPVSYEGKDEFDRVCKAFEEMRIRLKDSLYEQIKYEENRKELLANISHDLKTPITAIKGYMEGIRDGIADTPEKVNNYLDTIYNKSVLMNDLIDRLFLFSKLDLGKIQFHFQRIELGAFLQDTFEELRFDYPQMLIFFQKPESEIFVKADSTHLHRVITNLIDNAHKYCDSDPTEVTIFIQKMPNKVELKIRDNGTEIDDQMIPRIFEKFYRADASRSSRKEGSGLGLSIAKQIITAHGGTIKAGKSSGGGLEIIMTLRLDNEEDTHN